jgi:hypothetical protein
MEIRINPEEINKSQLVTFAPPAETIQVCGWCSGWWHENEFPKHTPECNRPYQGP